MVSAAHVGDTRGSGSVSSAVLWMSVVRGMRGVDGVCKMCMCLARGGVGVSVYCACRIPAHLRCTQCSILLHRMYICFRTCICLWQLSQNHTYIHPVSPHGWLAQNGKSGPHC